MKLLKFEENGAARLGVLSGDGVVRRCQTNLTAPLFCCYPVAMSRQSSAKPPSAFRYFNASLEVIRLVVLMYVQFPLPLRNVEDLPFERGIDLCHETVRL